MTINLVWANIFAAIFCFAVLLLSSSVWYFVWGFPTFEDFHIQFLPKHNSLLTFLSVWKIRKEPAANMVLDHPKEAGCMILEEDY